VSSAKPAVTPDAPVTVMIPVRNRADLLPDAVASALAQDRPLEVVIVDDGSTDKTPAVADALAADDARVRALHVPHGGPGAARNVALRAAEHELVANLDSDDLMAPDRLAHQVGLLVAHPEAAGCIGAVQHFVTPGERAPEHLVTAWRGNDGVQLGAMGTLLVRRTLALAVGGYDEEHRISEDLELYRRLKRSGHPIVIDDHLVGRRRLHDGNLSHEVHDVSRELLAFVRRGLRDRPT
jgi:glycosyltransferase involved in cell wall biosynthesis